MALREEFVRQGNWLFRWRSYLPILLLIPMLLAMWEFEYPGSSYGFHFYWAIFCLFVSFFGLMVRAVTVGCVPKGTSGRNTHEQVAMALNTTGMYSMVRHPLYVGNAIIWLGISIFCLRWWLAVIFMLLFCVYYERIMLAEEEFLRERFGDAFVQWADKTPAFIPRLRQWQRPAVSFSLRVVLRREYSGFFGIIVCFFGMELCEHIVMGHQPILEPFWVGLLVVGSAVYLTLRFLKKRTAILRVEGR